jgi:hypothetical protein
MKRHFTGVLKTSHVFFPKDFVQKFLSTALARSIVHLSTTGEAVQLMVTCYKCNPRKGLVFISTVGAGGMTDGNPYIQRWADDNGNIVTRATSRPLCRVQLLRAHTSGRQPQPVTPTRACDEGGLANPRLLIPSRTTVDGICIIDCWKLVKFHASASHPYSALNIKDFAEISSKTLVYKGQHDHVVSAQRRGRTISVPLAEPKRIFQEARVQVPGNSGRNKQTRCLRCYYNEDVPRWASFYCVQCGIPLCMPGSRHSRDCAEYLMRLDHVALGNIRRVRTEKTRPTTAPQLSFSPSAPTDRRAWCIIP